MDYFENKRHDNKGEICHNEYIRKTAKPFELNHFFVVKSWGSIDVYDAAS